MSTETRLLGVALLTGAASGIGEGVASSFAAAGCERIYLGDINMAGLERVKQEISTHYSAADVRTHQVDITDEKSVKAFVAGCVSAFGRIDYAGNIAGVAPQRTPIHETETATYDKTIHVNQCGTWLCHRAELEQMIHQDPLPGAGSIRGSIISVSSLAGLNASSGMSHYSASKHALIGIVKSDAQDFGPAGIRVNAVCPGLIDTALFRQTSPAGAPEKMKQVTPLRRLGQPNDIGKAMVWLSTFDASFITGAVLPVDGGLVLYRQGM